MTNHELGNFLYIISAFVFLTLAIVPRALSPELTEAQLFSEYLCHYIIGSSVALFLNRIAGNLQK